jgi:pentatricopeptide repeat protein
MRSFQFPRSLDFYVSLAKMLTADQNCKDVLDLYKEMYSDNIPPDRGLLICFINAAKTLGNNDQAIACFEELKNFGPPSMRTYMTVLSIYKSTRDCSGAVRLLEDMEVLDIEPDTLVLNHVLSLCVENGGVSDAEYLLNHWTQQSDVISCNTVLKGYSQQAALSKAETLLESMLTSGPAPNLVTFNTIMDCSVRSLHCLQSHCYSEHGATTREVIRRPWELLDQMLELGIEPDRYTCSIVVKGMHYSTASSADLDRAVVLLRRVGPGVLQPCDGSNANDRWWKNNVRLVEVLFNTLLDICASNHDLDQMVEIFAMMKEFKVNITNVTFGILIKAYGQAGRLPRCHEVWEGMLNANIRPTVVTYGCYIDACIRNSDVASAESIYLSMRSTKVRPNAVIYTSLIRGLSSAGEPAKAFKVYRQMRESCIENTAAAFSSVLDMITRQLSEPKVLESVLHDMSEVDATLDAAVCAMLIKACGNAGYVENAMSLFRQIQQTGRICDHAATNSLLLACARSDKVAEVEEVLGNMRQCGMTPNHTAISVLVKMYGRVRTPQTGFNFVETLQREQGVHKPCPSVHAEQVVASSFGCPEQNVPRWCRAGCADISDCAAGLCHSWPLQ